MLFDAPSLFLPLPSIFLFGKYERREGRHETLGPRIRDWPAGRPTDRPIRPRNVLASNYREKVCFAPRPCSSPGCEHGMHHRRRVSPGVIELTATLENRVYSVYTLYTRTYTRIRMSFVEALTST